MDQIYRDNREFFLKRETVLFLLFLFLSACAFKACQITSLGMGYELTLYFINSWILLARHRVTHINYMVYGFITPFIISLGMIILAVIFR